MRGAQARVLGGMPGWRRDSLTATTARRCVEVTALVTCERTSRKRIDT